MSHDVFIQGYKVDVRNWADSFVFTFISIAKKILKKIGEEF